MSCGCEKVEGPLWHRYVGDDWIWSASTDADVSGWEDPVIQIRAGRTAASTLLASNTGVDPIIHTDGDVDLGVPATNFNTGVFTWYIASEDTYTIANDGLTITVWIEVEAIVDGARTTVMPARPIVVHAELAVRP